MNQVWRLAKGVSHAVDEGLHDASDIPAFAYRLPEGDLLERMRLLSADLLRFADAYQVMVVWHWLSQSLDRLTDRPSREP